MGPSRQRPVLPTRRAAPLVSLSAFRVPVACHVHPGHTVSTRYTPLPALPPSGRLPAAPCAQLRMDLINTKAENNAPYYYGNAGEVSAQMHAQLNVPGPRRLVKVAMWYL